MNTAARIASLLAAQVPGARGVSVSEVERVFGGNARTAWAAVARWTSAGGAPVERPVIMLTRPPGSQVQVDPEAEFRALRALAGSPVPAPEALARDSDGSVVLSREPGRADPVALLQASDREWARGLVVELARAAAALHRVSPAPLGAVPERAAEVLRWREVYLAARMEPLPVLAGLFDWLVAHAPSPSPACLVHGDLRPGNFLYRGGELTALLDWEMAHVGDPAEDLAWVYRPLWSPDRLLGLDEFVRCYREFGGPPVSPERLLYHRVSAEVKFAAISLRAARAFADGSTTNLRLADRAATALAAVAHALDLRDQLERRC